MADITGTVQAVELVRGPNDAYGAETATGQLYSASLSVWNNTASVVNAATPDTLAFNAATAIQSQRRDGKTVTVRTAAIGAALVVYWFAVRGLGLGFVGTVVCHGFVRSCIVSAVLVRKKSVVVVERQERLDGPEAVLAEALKCPLPPAKCAATYTCCSWLQLTGVHSMPESVSTSHTLSAMIWQIPPPA